MPVTNYKTNEIVLNDSESIDYDVILTEGIFDKSNVTIKNYCKDRTFLIVMSPTVFELYGKEINEYFNYHFEDNKFEIITIPTSEKNKNMENILNICKAGKDFGLDRKSLMIAIGGGILMDMVGFAASMYKRKMNYIKIPTTLVGQIDAGIGIKTGINFYESKNFLGSYHPPIAALNDVNLLKTLDKVDILCGLAEIIKMAIVRDEKLFELIENNHKELIEFNFQKNKLVSSEVNQLSILRMLEELHGNLHEHVLARLVDFGHTFSPFIEVYTDYKVPHGIAVALDIAISTEIMYLKDGITKENRDRILNLLFDTGLKIYHEESYETKFMWESLEGILLHRGMDLNLVVPTGIGKATFIKSIDDLNINLLEKALSNLKMIMDANLNKQEVLV
ncbi:MULTISPECIES: sedoheptulose 7-phosphate cyclase [Bacillus cereus group]|uniref:3-dehydroquinate synthase n=1 Tax=Bacillus bombysepticus str. Wang TaxID=1330043 RepID=A0A9W3PTY7_9BACI|nr:MULTISPECIES: sedoheptulose 7-phosphate cyclase [Bacillus cereus group]AHX21661.1 3-dehydroquinate synthase [Bacillus bombysepticus str. Wang]MCE9758254.1 sedoheptulose 7-phosphate cyclase [Bacillus cereus]